MFAHLANPSMVYGCGTRASFHHKVRSYRKWGRSWGDLSGYSNQSAIYYITTVLETILKHFARLMLRHYSCVKLPVRYSSLGFGIYNTAVIKQFFLDIDWGKIMEVFRDRKKPNRKKHGLVSRLHKKDIQRYNFRRIKKKVRIWSESLMYAPRQFANDHAWGVETFGPQIPLAELNSIGVGMRMLRRWRRRTHRNKIIKIKNLLRGRHYHLFNSEVFWWLFQRKWNQQAHGLKRRIRGIRWRAKKKRHFKLSIKNIKLRVRKLLEKWKNSKNYARPKTKKLYTHLLKIEKLCDIFSRLKKKNKYLHLRARNLRIQRKKIGFEEMRDIGRFWMSYGSKLLAAPLKHLFQKTIGINYCYILIGRDHNIAMGMSAETLGSYLLVKIKQGFTLRSLLQTWRRSIRHFKGCVGWKICLSGRFDTNRLRGRATYIWISEGRVPFSNFETNLRSEYFATTTISRYGSCGFKVWLTIDRSKYLQKRRSQKRERED